jgi:hypothetical protein
MSSWVIVGAVALLFSAGVMPGGQSEAPASASQPVVRRSIMGRLEDARTAYARKDFDLAAKICGDLLAEQDVPPAETLLGLINMYRTNRNVPLAVSWYTKAANQGEAEAQLRLGNMYSEGFGVRKDNVQAHRWLSLGIARLTPADADFKAKASRALDSVVNQMSAAEIDAAVALAKETKIPLIHEPEWIRKPTVQETYAFYPRAAITKTEVDGLFGKKRERGYVSGHVILACNVNYNGGSVAGHGTNSVGNLENCDVLVEDPKDLGFGDAAIKVVLQKAILSPRMIDGEPAPIGWVRFPVDFKPE